MAKAVLLAKEAVRQGKCVVIEISTGESQIEAESKLLDFAPAGKGMLKWLVDNYFPVSKDSINKNAAIHSNKDLHPELEIGGTKNYHKIFNDNKT